MLKRSGPAALACGVTAQPAIAPISTVRAEPVAIVVRMRGSLPRWLWTVERPYCTAVVPGGMGFAMDAPMAQNIEPRVSVAKYRVPVPFGVTGSAFAQ
jgi:hypothetical protein